MEIIAQIGNSRTVERMVLGYTHRSALTYDLQDLCQMIYMALIDHPAEDLRRMYEAKELESYIGGIIRNQVSSVSSPYYYKIIKPSKTAELDERKTDGED